MTLNVPGEGERFLLPRWRTFGETVPLLESIGTREPHALDPDLTEAATSFLDYPGLFSAGDLVSQALVKGGSRQYSSALNEARRMLEDAGLLSPSVAREDGPEHAGLNLDDWRERVATNRRILREEPRNAIRWVDLALAHLALGNVETSERALRVALALSPDNRYALRSLARLATITGEIRAAQRIINTSGALHDPWVLAAEVALAESVDRGSRNGRLARSLSASRSVAPRHLSELRGALSMAALRAGDRKTATRQARLSLVDPTENSVAQVEWSRQHGVQLATSEFPNLENVGRTFEAEGRRLAAEGQFELALRQCVLWLADQPFATEAALYVSWLASTTSEHWDVAIAAAEQGLRVAPDEQMLRNNLAFALIHADRLDEAKAQLSMIDGDGVGSLTASTVEATRGLMAFREGNPTVGRALYESAEAGFRDQRLPHLTALARLFQAQEEIRLRLPTAAMTLADAISLANSTPDRVVGLWRERIVGETPEG